MPLTHRAGARRRRSVKRKKASAAVTRAVAAQRKALDTLTPPPSDGLRDAAAALSSLARELPGGAGAGARGRAAKAGVGELAEAYALAAKAGQATTLEDQVALVKRSEAARTKAKAHKRKAGDAWPF